MARSLDRSQPETVGFDLNKQPTSGEHYMCKEGNTPPTRCALALSNAVDSLVHINCTGGHAGNERKKMSTSIARNAEIGGWQLHRRAYQNGDRQ